MSRLGVITVTSWVLTPVPRSVVSWVKSFLGVKRNLPTSKVTWTVESWWATSSVSRERPVVSQDYEDLFRALNAFRIKYLVVGAHAVAFYAEPRFTKDMDVWVPPVLNDARRDGKTPICVLGLPELMRAKKAAGRPQDKLDLRRLLRRHPRPG